MKEVQVIEAIDSPEKFKALFKDPMDFIFMLDVFPASAEALIKTAAQLQEAYKYFFIKDLIWFELTIINEQAPGVAEKLINIMFKYPDKFKILNLSRNDLYIAIIKLPKHAERLINMVLMPKEEFRRIIESLDDFQFLAHSLKNSKILIQMLLNNSDEFQRLISDHHDLSSVVKQLPQHADALINFVLTHPGEFQRLITNQDQLSAIATKFPQHGKILNKSTLEEANQAVALYQKGASEIRKNIRVLSQGHRGQGFFSRLPPELQITVAGFTGSQEAHSEEQADKIAENNLGRAPK